MTSITTELAVLIIEDDAPKLRAIINFLSVELDITNPVIAKSLTSAIQKLSKQKFDLCIVDMSIPTYDFDADKSGGEPQSGGGRDILRFINSEAPSTKAVILTQYDEFPTANGTDLTLDSLTVSLLKKFNKILLAVIFYSTQKGEWRKSLKSIIKETFQ